MGKLFTVKQFAARNKKEGTWPDSEAGIRCLKANSPENGFGETFINIGKRVLIDEDKFYEAIRKLNGE